MVVSFHQTGVKNKILDRLCSSTTNQQYTPLTGMNYNYSVVNTKTIEQLFEHMLFRWSIVSEFSSAIKKLTLKDKSQIVNGRL